MRKKSRGAAKLLLIATVAIVFIAVGLFANKIINKAGWLMDKYIILLENVDELTIRTARGQKVLDKFEQRNIELDTIADRIEESYGYVYDYTWVERTPCLIAHAMGSVDGNTYTNTREAFEHNYAQGQRVFEVDFYLTDAENALIATHDTETWKKQTGTPEETPFTYAGFMSEKILGSYTPLDADAVIDLMIEYPDIYVVTDTKFTAKEEVYTQFGQLVRCAKRKDPSVLDRIIPQIYNPQMQEWVMGVYPFDSIILTLYQMQWTPQEVYEICKERHIGFLTVHKDLITPEAIALWDELGVTVACHTSNDQAETQKLFDMGVDLMYTDSLTPAQFE